MLQEKNSKFKLDIDMKLFTPMSKYKDPSKYSFKSIMY
jgi:hypothetical protein